MKKAAVLDASGVVTNTIILEDDGNALEFGAIDCPEYIAIGDSFNGFTWSRPDPQIDKDAINARNHRNMLLAESDWTQYNDSPLTEDRKTAWANYRQALRDISSDPGFPLTCTWPTKPE